MSLDREYLVGLCVTYLTEEEIIFELEIRNLLKDRDRSLSVNRRKLKNALREELDGKVRIFSYTRDSAVEMNVCKERLDRVMDNLTDTSLDKLMSKTGLLHLYHRLKLFRKTYGVGSLANEANWLFSKVIQTYIDYFDENILGSQCIMPSQVSSVPVDLRGAASLEAQAEAPASDLISLGQSVASLTISTGTTPRNNVTHSTPSFPNPTSMSTVELDPIVSNQTAPTSVSVARTPVSISAPVVTCSLSGGVQITWATPSYQVASRVHRARQVRFDSGRDYPISVSGHSSDVISSAGAQCSMQSTVNQVSGTVDQTSAPGSMKILELLFRR